MTGIVSEQNVCTVNQSLQKQRRRPMPDIRQYEDLEEALIDLSGGRSWQQVSQAHLPVCSFQPNFEAALPTSLLPAGSQ